MATIICPKCGFEQQGGAECARCGVIFERYRAPKESLPEWASKVSAAEVPNGVARRLFRVIRWLMLAAFILVFVLLLRPAEPPHVDTDPAAKEHVRAKLDELRRAREAGEPHALKLEEPEINSWLESNLALTPKESGTAAAPSTPTDQQTSEATVHEVRSSMRDLKVNLLDDRLRAYVVFDFHGKDLSLQLEGRLRAENGYLKFQPTSGKLGSMPLPQTVLDEAVKRIFDSPENREKLKLPPEIADIHIENHELIVSYR